MLMEKVAAQTASMDPLDFNTTIIPFLKGIIVRLREGKDEHDTYKFFFQICLWEYITRFVGLEPVQTNWSRSTVDCPCMDCRDLNRFLRSPVDQVGKFKAAKTLRHHLHVQLDRWTDCKHETDRSGYPETLVVTKDGKSFAEKIGEWNMKATQAMASLRFLEAGEASASTETNLKKLLGDKYDDTMALKDVRIMTVDASSSARTTARSIAATQRAAFSSTSQVAGQKRKAVVIDLTDD